MRAGPAPALELNERLSADSVQLLQVLDHAHAVLGAIALVEPAEASAGKGCAGDAQSFWVRRQLLARLDGAHHAVPWLGGVV